MGTIIYESAQFALDQGMYRKLHHEIETMAWRTFAVQRVWGEIPKNFLIIMQRRICWFFGRFVKAMLDLSPQFDKFNLLERRQLVFFLCECHCTSLLSIFHIFDS